MDRWVKDGEEGGNVQYEQKEERLHIHHTCDYTDYTGDGKLKLSESEVV